MSSGTRPGSHLCTWQQAALLVGITLAVFLPTLSAGFVYDARLQILTDPFLHDPRNWLPVLTFGTLSMDVLDFNRPVNLASLMLDAAVWGKEPFGYHLTSVLLHAANVLMVWRILRASMGSPRREPEECPLEDMSPGSRPGLPDREMDVSPGFRPGLFVRGQAGLPVKGPSELSEGGVTGPLAVLLPPLLFAVHPVVTEAVCEPTFREDLLVAFFTLAGLLLAIGHAASAFDGWRAAGCVACSLLAIGSKESGIAAPAVIGVYWLVVRRRERGLFWPVSFGGGTLVVIVFLIARFLLEPTPSKIFEARPQYPGGSLAAAMAIEPRILALYAQLILLPLNQCADYGLFSVRHLPLPVAIPIVAALTVAAWFMIRADRRMAVAVALVVFSLLPVANLVPIYRAAADRYLYLPMAGVALGVGCLLTAPWLAHREWLRQRLVIGAAAAALLLGFGCMERQKVWANPLPLWTDTFQKNPVAYTAASGLAEAFREAGRFAEAEQAARRAIELSEGQRGDPWATLALILDAQGRSAEAFDALDRAVDADPKLADPDARAAVMAMEQPYADDLKRLQARRNALR